MFLWSVGSYYIDIHAHSLQFLIQYWTSHIKIVEAGMMLFFVWKEIYFFSWWAGIVTQLRLNSHQPSPWALCPLTGLSWEWGWCPCAFPVTESCTWTWMSSQPWACSILCLAFQTLEPESVRSVSFTQKSGHMS